MPDRTDVEQALAVLVAGALYPDGADADSAVGAVCKVYRGWPVAQALDADLERGIVHVSIVPVAGAFRDRTRYSAEWQGAVPATTLSASVTPEAVTFDGFGGPGQVAGIAVDGQAYAYRMQKGDSASLVAAALAALIRADRPALASENTVQLISPRGLVARVVADGQGGEEVRRQEGRFRLSFWCPDPGTRDQVVSLVDVSLASLTFIDVVGWACRLQIVGESSSDDGAAGGLWRRDLIYQVEYPTVLNQVLPTMLFGVADVNDVDWIG